MRYMLDTNICIYLAKHKPPSVLEHFRCLSVGDVLISSIAYGELRFGCEGSMHRDRAIKTLESLLLPLDICAFDAAAAEVFGRIRQDLKQRGQIIGPFDLLIAAHAMSLGCVLVSNNVREFERVRGLSVENWVE